MKNLITSQTRRELVPIIWLTVSLFAIAFILSTKVEAQTTVSAPSIDANVKPFSPSITSFIHGTGGSAVEYDICAYAYPYAYNSETPAQHRTVGISRSTNGGATWSVLVSQLSDPASGYHDIDDPQILSLGNGTLVCVVRAWSDNFQFGGNGAESYYAGLAHTIFTDAGIFMTVSTNEGTSWGTWQTVWQNTTGGDPSTVEHPRIAYRPGFDNKGYIVWDWKEWSNDATVTYNVNGTDSTYSGAAAGLRVEACKIGIRAFGSDGTLYNYNGSDPYMPSSINTSKHSAFGPEGPSVAISPDGQLWIAYQQITYWANAADGTFSFNNEQWWGGQEPIAWLYVTNATCNIDASNAANFTFSTPQEVVHDELLGFYNQNRGYLYGECLASTTSAWLDGELAQGPSIQVACANPRSCSAPYTVGVVQAWGDGETPSSGPDPRSWLSFIYADVPRGATALIWYNAIPSSNLNPKSNNDFDDNGSPFGNQVDWANASMTDDIKMDIRWFPVLKYVTASDQLGAYYPDEGSNVMPSFFVMSWMYAYVSNVDNDADGAYLDTAVCRTAVSFDNHSFTITNSSGTEGLVRSAETGSVYQNIVDASHWGTKIDICGDAGLFTVHPIWHEVEPAGANDALETNAGGCLLVRPFVSNYGPGNPSAFPGNQCLTKNGGSTDYNLLGVYTMGSLPSLTSVGEQSPITVNGRSFSSAGFLGNELANGLSEAVYGGNPLFPQLGSLGFSSQRKIVMTGNTAHLVGFGGPGSGILNNPQAIWYSEQTSIPSAGSTVTTDWSAPIELDNNDPGWTYATAPAIAVYQRGGNSDQKAVAVAWSEGSPLDIQGHSIHYIFIRVKEYEKCEGGDQSDWSPVDSIPLTWPEQIYATAYDNPVAIAPLTAPVPGTNERYLIGWTVTTLVNSLKLISVTYLRGTESQPNLLTNQNWWPHAGMWAEDNLGHKLVNWILSGGIKPAYKVSGFISVTSNESNDFGRVPNNDISTNAVNQTVCFSFDGTKNGSPYYYVPSYAIVPGNSAPFLGEITNWAGYSLNSFPIPSSSVINPYTVHWYASLDRNPCVTINSAGQNLVAWEHMEGATYVKPSWYPYIYDYSSIRLAQSNPTPTPYWSTIKDFIDEGSLDLNFNWLRNPSLTAFPKSTVGASNNSLDPGAAELLFWQQKTPTKVGFHWSWSETDALHERRFWKPTETSPWFSGQWHNTVPNGDPTGWGNPWPNGYSGCNSQRSFGVYNSGPQWDPLHPLNLIGQQGQAYNYGSIQHGLTYGIGNNVSSGTPQLTVTSPAPDVGAYKGTFDTALGIQIYRSETRSFDSSEVSFIWGKVYVEDTALNRPIREVILNDGQPDSGFVSHDAMRDSIFATEWFDWPISAEIKYDRMMMMPVAGTFDTVVDTSYSYSTQIDSVLVDTAYVYDTVIDSAMVFDTVNGAFHPDTTYRMDRSFFAPGTQMKYTVQLIHSGGHIDTVETCIYNPSSNEWIEPTTVTIANGGMQDDTVMLRVLGDFTNVPDADTNVGFARETTLDSMVYQTLADTTIAIGTGGGIIPPPDTCFAAMGPFSDPSEAGANDVSILVHYCGVGGLISAQVYDYLGNPIGSPSTYIPDGQPWDRLPITSPSTSGSYYVTVTIGGYSTTIGYAVY